MEVEDDWDDQQDFPIGEEDDADNLEDVHDHVVDPVQVVVDSEVKGVQVFSEFVHHSGIWSHIVVQVDWGSDDFVNHVVVGSV